MSEPKLVSPLLDGFVMGAPLSKHHGVCCCPAMKENSDDKYIVKIISVPASQSQLDALLLTGACKDAAAAMEYFKELSDGIVREAEALNKLSKLEGFLPYTDWQVVPMENNDLGYDVYLVSPYRLSLEKYMRRNLLTHLNAVNLGLDMCAALAICRNAGKLYVDLKPSNIFVSEDKEFRIGDLGFVELNSLKYTSLPSKYRSVYTAPEALDDMNTLNTTVDIYAAGLILYQVYNNGELPFEGQAKAEVFPAPVNADYEITEIILKALAPDPADRWQDPIEMGQALVAYMQRNGVNDVPIAPPVVGEVATDEPVTAEAEGTPEESSEELAFMQTMVSDDTAPDEADADQLSDAVMTEEGTDLLAQAEDLIAHDAPEPVAAPQAVPVTIPDAREEQAPPVEAGFDEMDLDEADFDEDDLDEDDYEEDDYDEDEYDEDDYEEEDEDPDRPKKKKTGWIIAIILVLLFSLVAYGGFYFYRNYYQQNIDDIHVSVSHNQLTVTIDTKVDPSLLGIICTDSYGNARTATIQNGQAVFTDLQPGTMYTIKLTISGFHELTGMTSISASTEEQTEIIRFAAVTGPEDGSVVLDFTVSGQETQEWSVIYSTEGEETRTVTFTGHMVTVNGLTVGKTYLFELKPSVELYLTGQTSLEFTASSIVTAENLSIKAFTDGSLTAQWGAPADTVVDSWTVRCYSDTGYDETIITGDTNATFTDVPSGAAYTVEVTAAGMTQPVRASLTANPITVSAFHIDESDPMRLSVSWDYSGEAPEGGWLLTYTVDGSAFETVVQCETNSAVVEPRIPGANYVFNVQAARVVTTIFGGKHSYSCPNASPFTDHDADVSSWTFKMCKTPDKADWTYKNVKNEDYTTTFTVGEKISFVIRSTGHYYTRMDKTVLYVIRDSNGKVLPELTGVQTQDWFEMWDSTYPYANLTLPKTLEVGGDYKLYLYFDGAAVCVLDFTVVENTTPAE